MTVGWRKDGGRMEVGWKQDGNRMEVGWKWMKDEPTCLMGFGQN